MVVHSRTILHQTIPNLHVILGRNSVLVNLIVTTECKVIRKINNLSTLLLLSQLTLSLEGSFSLVNLLDITDDPNYLGSWLSPFNI